VTWLRHDTVVVTRDVLRAVVLVNDAMLRGPSDFSNVLSTINAYEVAKNVSSVNFYTTNAFKFEL